MISTGIKGLDDVIAGLRSGDNVVWQIDDIKDYIDLVNPFVCRAIKENKKVIYMRSLPLTKLFVDINKQYGIIVMDICS